MKKILSYEEINTLNELLAEKLELVIDFLSLDLKERNKYYVGSCHLHCGDNKTAFNLYKNGTWYCRTHNCHIENGKKNNSLLNLIQKTLRLNFKEAIQKSLSLLNNPNLEVDQVALAKKKIDREIGYITQKVEDKQTGITRETIRGNLEIPAKHYINLGFSESTLDLFDVGLCTKLNKPMTNRIVVPVYDTNYSYIGCSGRSIFEKCENCSGYHNPKQNCPNFYVSKWRHQDLESGSCLYGLNLSKKEINDRNTVILTEGPKKVWKLWDSGIKHSVATFGTSLTEKQIILLESLTISDIIILYDNNDAGKRGAENIQNRLKKIFRVKIPEFNFHNHIDIDSMPTELVKEELLRCKL